MTGPLRIGVLFRYRTKLRIKQAKRRAPINPVTTPNATLRTILRTPFLNRGEVVVAVGNGGPEEARRLLALSWHFASEKWWKESRNMNTITILAPIPLFPISKNKNPNTERGGGGGVFNFQLLATLHIGIIKFLGLVGEIFESETIRSSPQCGNWELGIGWGRESRNSSRGMRRGHRFIGGG